MPVDKPAKVPKLRIHKATGQRYIVLNGPASRPRAVPIPNSCRRRRDRQLCQPVAAKLS